MNDVTRILGRIEAGDQAASDELFPLVYDELREMAANKLFHEKPGQTLQATGLVHEAYLRLVDVDAARDWDSRGHFFAAAAEAMRRVLVEQARRKRSLKRGGDRVRQALREDHVVDSAGDAELLELNEALEKLETVDQQAAELGEGGFGVVFLAEQQAPIRRRVALKIIKLGMDTRQVIVRFEAERQALAMMDHQNIARVLDAGTTDSGRPYFVMELVRGAPITEYCDRNKLTLVERLKLFIPVCRAIQHAHQKGIIHRDSDSLGKRFSACGRTSPFHSPGRGKRRRGTCPTPATRCG
jgi:RNA polymerase sigma factor (TIGR02999 family)